MLSRLQKPAQTAAKCVTQSLRQRSSAVGPVTIGEKSQSIFHREDKYGAHNYGPLPVALERAEGDNCLMFSRTIALGT